MASLRFRDKGQGIKTLTMRHENPCQRSSDISLAGDNKLLKTITRVAISAAITGDPTGAIADTIVDSAIDKFL